MPLRMILSLAQGTPDIGTATLAIICTVALAIINAAVSYGATRELGNSLKKRQDANDEEHVRLWRSIYGQGERLSTVEGTIRWQRNDKS